MTLIADAIDRRGFLKTGMAGAAGFVIGFYLPGRSELLAASPAAANAPADLNAWIHIGTDDKVTITIDKSEMGQGILTSLAMLAAEELECDWQSIRTEFALAKRVYYNPAFGMQGTGGSSSIRSSYDPMRKAGATAREMLLQAAAQRWGVVKSECHAEDGAVIHAPTKRRLRYGSIAADAATVTPPADVPLKDASQFKVIGKPLKRLDTPMKVNGRAEFGIDVRRSGMLHAVVARCPVFGGKVASFDASKAKAIPGVRDVLQISSGIAVIADNTWTAMESRRALDVKWDEGAGADVSSASIHKFFAEQAERPSPAARKDGDAEANLASAAQKIEAIYEAPYMAHATMEPMNCTADVGPHRCEIWAPTQFQTVAQSLAAKIVGTAPESVVLHTTYLGGGFGRRGNSDFIIEAVEVSKVLGVPIQVTWSREDDMQHDFYRPASYCHFKAGLDASGQPTALTARIACQSVLNAFFPGSIKNGLDPQSVEGVADMEYAIPGILVNYAMTDATVPIGFWRSVGNSQNGFFSESFIDELAAAAKQDPYEFRRRLLAKAPRRLGVLELAAEKAGWGSPLPQGRHRGIAVLGPFSSFAAQVVEVSVDQKAGTFKVHRVVCAFDCGRVVNPDTIAAQMQSGIVYGLSMMKGEITIDKGRVQQSNFNDYPVVRINEMPAVEVYIVPSTEKPTGAGEPGVPCLAPAVCNAIFAATGKRIKRLPIRPEDFA